MLYRWRKERLFHPVRRGMASGEGDGLPQARYIHAAGRRRRKFEGERMALRWIAWGRKLEHDNAPKD